jgi:hypothetical protein
MDRIGKMAGWLGPWSLWGMDLSPNDARLIRLERRPGGWQPAWQERANNSDLEDWARKLRLASRGVRVALGGFPVHHVLPGSDDPSLPAVLPEDLERMAETQPVPHWDFWWRAGHLESALRATGLDEPDSVHSASVLLPGLLNPASCPPVWIAVRVLARLAQVWFMREDRIERFLELDGGREDPALLGTEWLTLHQEIPTSLPDWESALVAYLDASSAGLLDAEGKDPRKLDTPWSITARAIPEDFRFAAAVALNRGKDALDESVDGSLAIDARGRIEASHWIWRGLSLAFVVGILSVGILVATNVQQRTNVRLQMEIGKYRNRLEQLDRMDARNRRLREWDDAFRRSGGGLAPSLAAVSRCWPEGAWVEDWSGKRSEDRFNQTLTAWTSSGPDGVSNCLKGLPGNLKIQSTETWSPERWSHERVGTISAPLLHLGIQSGMP